LEFGSARRRFEGDSGRRKLNAKLRSPKHTKDLEIAGDVIREAMNAVSDILYKYFETRTSPLSVKLSADILVRPTEDAPSTRFWPNRPRYEFAILNGESHAVSDIDAWPPHPRAF